MDKKLQYTLREEDLEKTAGGIVNLVLKKCVRVTGHEISAAKFEPEGITCDGVPVRVSERIRPGQTLRVVLPERGDAGKLIPEPGPVRVLYEDEDLIVVDKAAGEVVHPCHGHYSHTVANHVADYLNRGGEDGSGGLRVIGRLDKETSGVLLFAKNRAAAARLQRQRQDGRLARIYLAVCAGEFPAEGQAGTIDRPMEKVPGDLMKMRVVPEERLREAPESEPGVALRAVTHYEVLAQAAGCALLKVRIETGRTHQIRVHMASAGHPLIGDTLYGPEAPRLDHTKSMPAAEGAEAWTRALLHAASVRLEQPFTGETVRIRAPLPKDFRGYLANFSGCGFLKEGEEKRKPGQLD